MSKTKRTTSSHLVQWYREIVLVIEYNAGLLFYIRGELQGLSVQTYLSKYEQVDIHSLGPRRRVHRVHPQGGTNCTEGTGEQSFEDSMEGSFSIINGT